MKEYEAKVGKKKDKSGITVLNEDGEVENEAEEEEGGKKEKFFLRCNFYRFL